MSKGFKEAPVKPDKPKPHYLGHRERLRERFVRAGAEALPDYELLELVLFRSLPRRDTKPIAKALLEKFGSFAEVISAPPERLREVKGIGDSVAIDLKLVQAAAQRLSKSSLLKKLRCIPGHNCWNIVVLPWPIKTPNNFAFCFSTRKII